MMQCPRCAVVHPSDVESCPCGFVFVPQDSRIPQGASTDGSAEASILGRRVAARIIDNAIALLLGIFVYMLLEPFKPEYGVPVLAGYAAMIAYIAYILSADGLPWGPSIGKKMLSIGVINEATGKSASFADSCKRNVWLLILGPFDLVTLIGLRKKRLGDHFAGTMVVRQAEI